MIGTITPTLAKKGAASRLTGTAAANQHPWPSRVQPNPTGQRLYTGRVAVAQAALTFSQGVFARAWAYCDGKQCFGQRIGRAISGREIEVEIIRKMPPSEGCHKMAQYNAGRKRLMDFQIFDSL